MNVQTWLVVAIGLGLLSLDSREAWSQRAAGRLQERFEQLDQDGDGQLSLTEFDRGETLHAKVDSDNSGGVSLSEVRSFLRGGGILGAAAPPDAKASEKVGKITDEMPVTIESCRNAAEYSRSANGHAVLVQFDGTVVYERYDNGWDATTPHRLASGTKSFAGAVAAAATADGLLTLDEKVCKTIGEWKGDTRLSKITIRQLLGLISGIDPGQNTAVLPYSEVINIQAVDGAGRKFRYGPNAFQIFGALMGRKLAKLNSNDPPEDYLGYLRRRILQPIGMETGIWRRTSEGDPHVPSGAHVTALQWAKFGDLMRRDGAWKGKPILPAATLKELTTGSAVNRRYGVTFWLGVAGGVGAGNDLAGRQTTPELSAGIPRDMFMAAGAGKQRLYVIPSLKLVVVRMGETKGRGFRDDVFLKRLLGSNSKPDPANRRSGK